MYKSMKKQLNTHDAHSRNASLSKAQDLLFELMTTTDRQTEEGERLVTFYAYLNQCLVEIRISGAHQFTETSEVSIFIN